MISASVFLTIILVSRLLVPLLSYYPAISGNNPLQFMHYASLRRLSLDYLFCIIYHSTYIAYWQSLLMFAIRYNMDAVIKIFSLKSYFDELKLIRRKRLLFSMRIIHPQFPLFHKKIQEQTNAVQLTAAAFSSNSQSIFLWTTTTAAFPHRT